MCWVGGGEPGVSIKCGLRGSDLAFYNRLFPAPGSLFTFARRPLCASFPSHSDARIMKVATGSAAAAAGPSCALKAGKTAGGAGEVVRCLSEQSVAISRCAGGAGARLPALLDEQQVNVLLYDMNGCYSRLKELVPTLPQNRKVSRVEILQHVIDYIWDLELELNSESQVGTPGGRGLPARAPLSTLNGEISALAAEVRSELEHESIALLQMGKLRPGVGGNLARGRRPPFGHLLAYARSERALP